MPIEIRKDGGFCVSGEEGMKLYRMATILQGMYLELKGMRLTRKAPSCFTIARREFGLKGNRLALIQQFSKLVEDQSAKVPRVYPEGEP